ncbi:MAG TPA: SusD/RagB family nutrient-binding outer membrane lipoprotein, partial [Bacteroidia bacterium]|nr:SusD/RagB family nutrient-binding outer membrane lipoprotein [Bacteroidia bacterium]
MKNLKSIKYVIGVALLLSTNSCKKSYFEDINTSPNQPTSITPAVALPWSEVSICYALGGDISRISSIYMQYVTGEARQMQSYNSYIFTEENFSNLWGNMYAGHMNNLNDQIKKCNEKNYKYYAGISKILMAYSLGIVTDCWGSAPYSEAFKGAEGLKPKYDSQDALYNNIRQLLSDGLADLNNSNGGDLKPATDDLIYGGKVANWKKFANALSARFYIHLCKVDGSAAQKALDAINAGAFTANTDDAQIVYGTTATNAAPWYQYNSQRGDIAFRGTFLDSMIKYADPR